MKISNHKKSPKVLELAGGGTASGLDPSVSGLLRLPKLCFKILAALRADHEHLQPSDRQYPGSERAILERSPLPSPAQLDDRSA